MMIRSDVVDVIKELGETIPGIAEVMKIVRPYAVPPWAPCVLISAANDALGGYLSLINRAHFKTGVMKSIPNATVWNFITHSVLL